MQLHGLARLGRDAEIRVTPSGDSVATLSLAFNYGRKDANTGKKPSEWVKASIWGKQAEALAPYLLKGKMICVTIDDPHIEIYTKQDGTTASTLAGRVSAVEFAGGGEQQQPQQAAQPRSAQQRPAAQPARQQAPVGSTGSGFDDMDDDIPF